MSSGARLAATLSQLRRRWLGRVIVVDPRPVAAAAPYTYFLPSENELLALAPGDLVQVTLRSDPPGSRWDAERLWFTVLTTDRDQLHAALETAPDDLPQLRSGQRLTFPRGAVIDIVWRDDRVPRPPSAPPRRGYWARCLVDDCVLNGRSKVHYLYRETPDMAEPDDRYEDSGWRLRGSDPAVADDERRGLAPCYVALGAVLNRDDSWLPLIDAGIGSAFVRNARGGYDAVHGPDPIVPPNAQQ